MFTNYKSWFIACLDEFTERGYDEGYILCYVGDIIGCECKVLTFKGRVVDTQLEIGFWVGNEGHIKTL